MDHDGTKPDGSGMEDHTRHEKERQRLHALVQSFEMLNSSLELDIVLTRTLEQAVALMEAEMGSIALLDEENSHLVFVQSTDPNFSKLKQMKVPLDKGIAGYVARSGESVRVEDVSSDDRFYSRIDESLKHQTKTYLCVPLVVNETVIGTAQLINRLDGGVFSIEDQDLFIGFARQAAIAIQNARLHRVLMKQQAMDSELRVCNEIQTNLYPREVPVLAGFQLFGQTIPCKEVGGDYYTFIPRSDGSLDVVIADVSGKGVSAAMLVSEIHTGIQLLSRLSDSLSATVEHLNNHLLDTIITGKFITFFIARLHPEQDRFEYINAGHPSPFLIRSDGRVEELENTSPFLGFRAVEMKSRWAQVFSGDTVLSFSDAYSESRNSAGDLFGEEKIAKVGLQNKEKPLEKIAEALQQKTKEHREGKAADDDATLVFFRRL